MTKEEIARAKELDLLTYFKLVEPGNLKLVGKEYRHKVHSSLTISKDSLWCWHCIGLRGRTALKYLIDVEKVPYVEAVREINRIQGGVVHSSQPVSLPQPRAEPEVPRTFTLPEPDTNSYSAMAYLRGRCIHPNVLAFCRKEGILYQTSFKNHPNCVFVGRDGEGVAKGGSLRGCTQLQFRRDIPGSKKIYPFYIQASAKADTVEVYEAPIDAMSGASLKLMQHTGPWRSVHYLALGGTDYAALDAFLKYFPAVCKIVLCLDNDNAGRTRTQDIIAHLAGSGKAVDDRPPPVGKDYNDTLVQYMQEYRAHCISMLTVLDQVWNRITRNRVLGRRTWVFTDEFQQLLGNKDCTDFYFQLSSRARKWGAILTSITQHVRSVLDNEDARRMLSDCGYIKLLNQSPDDANDLARLLHISNEEKRYIENAEVGSGLLIVSKTVVPFNNDFPKDTELFRLMDTSPNRKPSEKG